jgi:hypothetical protein
MAPTNSESKLRELRSADTIIGVLITSKVILSPCALPYVSRYTVSDGQQAPSIPGEFCWQLPSVSDEPLTSIPPNHLSPVLQGDEDITFQDNDDSFNFDRPRTPQKNTRSTQIDDRPTSENASPNFPGQYSFQLILENSNVEEQETIEKDIYGRAANPFNELSSVSHSSERDEHSSFRQSTDGFAAVQDVEVGDTGFQMPESYPEGSISTDLHPPEAQSDLEFTTQKLLDQLLSGFHGCHSEQHAVSLEAHLKDKRSRHNGLANLFPENVPSTLSAPNLLPRQPSSEQPTLEPEQWQELFCGSSPHSPTSRPKQACLHVEEFEPLPPEMATDFDSLLGFATSLAVAPQGLHYYSAPQFCQNIQNDVHLRINRAISEDEAEDRPRLIPSKLKDVPHFLLARFAGANYITLHIFFPHLKSHSEFHNLTGIQFSRWFDQIFYPALDQIYHAHYIQHLPASYQHGLASCRAPQIEDRLKETASYRSQLKLSYFLPPWSLHQLWLRILQTVEQPGLHDFRNPKLYFSAKGTKLQFKPQTPSKTVLEVMENFKSQLHNVISLNYVLPEQLYVDMASETCPPSPSMFANPQAATPVRAQTYLWRRCCLKAYLEWLYNGKVPKSNQNIYHNVMLRDACDMTSLTPRRSRLRRGGLLYSQFYSLTKEVIDAAKTFPFQNPGLGELSLDSRLRSSAENIVGSSRRSGVIIKEAYIASKRRCHFSLLESSQKSFEIREEHRISWPLFLSLMQQLRSMDDDQIRFRALEPPSYVWPLRTNTLFHFIRRNVDKFATGFELVRARSQPGSTTWEQTKMMEMFLRCLKFSSSSHNYSREGAIWWSRRERPLGATGQTQVWCGLGFSRTLERYGYCWIEPRIDWSRLVFFPDVTDHVLFGARTLQKQYLQPVAMFATSLM